MNKPFREKDQPKRTYNGDDLSPYQLYKKILAKDFNNRCGYSDCPDFWFGGISTFHIDHFAPISQFPHLKEKYSNMVYSCSYVNRAKSNDWKSNNETTPIVDGKGYLDPVNNDFNEHFYRDISGNIIPKDDSTAAQYMHKKMKLYLKRYSVIWTLDLIHQKIKLLNERIKLSKDDLKKKELYAVLGELSSEFFEYLGYLEVERR